MVTVAGIQVLFEICTVLFSKEKSNREIVDFELPKIHEWCGQFVKFEKHVNSRHRDNPYYITISAYHRNIGRY